MIPIGKAEPAPGWSRAIFYRGLINGMVSRRQGSAAQESALNQAMRLRRAFGDGERAAVVQEQDDDTFMRPDDITDLPSVDLMADARGGINGDGPP